MKSLINFTFELNKSYDDESDEIYLNLFLKYLP